MNIFFAILIIFIILYILLNWFAKTSTKKISKFVRTFIIISSILLAVIMAYANVSSQAMSIDESYRILNLDPKKKYTKDEVLQSYKKIMKKIHPDRSPELNNIATLVNEAKENVIKNIS